MNKYRVTCLLGTGEHIHHDVDTDGHGEEIMRRVFATRQKFATREAAQQYADGCAPSREPLVGFCDLETEYTSGHWTVYDPDEYDGPGGQVITRRGDRFDELQAVWDFCEMFDRCTMPYLGVPCGGKTKELDQAGSGWSRCGRCGML